MEANKILPLVQDYLTKGVVREVPKDKCPGWRLGHFTVPKANGKLRLVSNWKPINKCLLPPPTLRLVKTSDLPGLIYKGSWACSVDLSDAYNHLRWNKGMAWLTTFQLEDRCFQWEGLGFGNSWILFIWCRVLRSALTPLRRLGIQIVDYLDDLLVVAKDPATARAHTTLLVEWLTCLGFSVNLNKSELDPSQEFTFLGVGFDTKRDSMFIPPKKVQKGCSMLQQVLLPELLSVHKAQVILGFLQSLGTVIRMPRLRLRELQQFLTVHTPRTEMETSQCLVERAKTKYQLLPMSQHLVTELKWWLKQLQSPVCQNLTPHSNHPQVVVWTDASEEGWGVWAFREERPSSQTNLAGQGEVCHWQQTCCEWRCC